MSALNTLVDETTNIKNELITCHSNLKNNLTKKDVTCEDNDKMCDLIEKVKTISTKTQMVASDEEYIYIDPYNMKWKYMQVYPDSLFFTLKCNFEGSVRVSIDMKSASEGFSYSINYGGKYYVAGGPLSSNFITLTKDIVNLKKDDVIRFYGGKPNGYSIDIKRFEIKGSIVK